MLRIFRPADRSPSNELNAPLEQLLPGVAIANLPDGTDFLFEVADLGARLNRTDLRDNARFLLQLIPADQKVDFVIVSYLMRILKRRIVF